MKKRSVVAVLINCFWTCGIFAVLWFIQAKRDMNDRGEKIPTAWWLIVPGANLWWQWKWCNAFERLTRASGSHKRISAGVAFLVSFVAFTLAPVIFQDIMNAAVDTEHVGIPAARVVS